MNQTVTDYAPTPDDLNTIIQWHTTRLSPHSERDDIRLARVRAKYQAVGSTELNYAEWAGCVMLTDDAAETDSRSAAMVQSLRDALAEQHGPGWVMVKRDGELVRVPITAIEWVRPS